MKKIYLLLAVLLSIIQLGYAQEEPATVSADAGLAIFHQKATQMLGNLDKSKVPYGLLKDMAYELVDMDSYQGFLPIAIL